MAWPKIVDRSAVQILFDDRGADVRGAGNGRCIPQALAHAAHDCGHDTLLLCHRLDDAALGKGDRGFERAAPGAEILRGEFVAHVSLDVLVELPAGQVADSALALVAEEAPA